MTQAVGGRSRIWSATILIALGVLFLLDGLGVLNFGHFLGHWWPSVLIVMGLLQLLRSGGHRWGGPMLLICVGVLFQVSRLHVFAWWRAENLWPLVLIAVGVGLLVGRWRPAAPPQGTAGAEEASEVVDSFVLWSGLERTVTSKKFRGGDATAFMGGIQLDLRQAELAPGEQVLHLTAILGGIEVRVPESWQVAVDGTPLLGGISQKRAPAAAVPSAPPDSAAPAPTAADAPAPAGRLRIRGFALMGGVEVKT